MFRKLVSSLPFSPALVGQLGFYARRLSKEQAMRRLGLIFTLLAVMVQVFALISPPEQSVAASPTSQCSYNSALSKDDARCLPCPYNSTVWIESNSCNANVTLTVDAINLSKSGKPAANHTADPTDRIQYNLHTQNHSSTKTNVAVQLPLADLLEYGTVIDDGGGSFDQATQTISWGTIPLDSKQTDTRSFVVQLNSSFASTPQATDNPHSYDCVLTSTYGNTIDVPLSCPLGKQVESTVKQLPETGAGGNTVFALIAVMVVTYFYARSRQMNREMRIIRREFNVG